MQREIKFRGLDGNGQWAYGSLINNMWTFSELTERSGQNVSEIITGDYDSDNWQDAIEEEENLVSVRTETVGQHIGLKDKNGKDIYESDIVLFGKNLKGAVSWNQQYCGFWIDFIDTEGKKRYSNFNVTFSDGDIFQCDSIEVIGNIYQNPTLIK